MFLGATSTPDGTNEFIKVFVVVIDGELLAFSYLPNGMNQDTPVVYLCFRIRVARVIDVPRGIRPRLAIDGPFSIDLKKVPRRKLVRLCRSDPLSGVFQDEIPFLDIDGGKETESETIAGFLHLKSTIYRFHRGVSIIRSMKKRDKLSTEPYKGVRDFYPEEQFVQRYMFEHMERVCELFGYEEYNASVLEPSELYLSKTSEEIVNNQTYTFTDRGDRSVTLRPELTPTLARMIAARQREIPFPARWYSIGNCFRYEGTQKGRLREFWQLNADIIGVSGAEADAEIIAMVHGILRSMGAEERDFEIRVSDRRILDATYEDTGVEEGTRAEVTRLLDKRGKLEDFDAQLVAILGKEKAAALIATVERTTSSAYLEELRIQLEYMGIRNMVVDTKITRGFDYYTGMVFEVFDTHEGNRRSLAGGGRYDNLLSLFGGEPIPAVGFALGDVTAKDFLEAHNLLPAYAPATELMICVVEPEASSHAVRLAQDLRKEDITVAINTSGKRVGDQIRQADKMKIPFVIAVGAKERDSGRYTVKNLSSGVEITLPADRIAEHLFGSLG